MVLIKCREIREKKDFTLQEVAAAACCSVTTIQNAEKGRGVNRNTGKKIAQAMGVKLESLLYEGP